MPKDIHVFTLSAVVSEIQVSFKKVNWITPRLHQAWVRSKVPLPCLLYYYRLIVRKLHRMANLIYIVPRWKVHQKYFFLTTAETQNFTSSTPYVGVYKLLNISHPIPVLSAEVPVIGWAVFLKYIWNTQVYCLRWNNKGSFITPWKTQMQHSWTFKIIFVKIINHWNS